MTGAPKVLRNLAFITMAAVGLLGCLFLVGETFDDPGGWRAVALSALWIIPTGTLIAMALLRPGAAGTVLVVATALVGVFTLVDAAFGVIPRDAWGPVAAIAVFALGVVLAFLGLSRPTLAGLLMTVAALAQLAATMTGSDGDGPGARLGGSSGVVVLPVLMSGLLFLLAGIVGHQPLGRDLGHLRPSSHRPVPH